MALLMHRSRNRGVTGVKAGGGKTWHTTGPYINMEELKLSDEPAQQILATERGNPLVTEADDAGYNYPLEPER